MTGDDLRTIRRNSGLTIKAFAKRLGYHPNYVLRLERGEAGLPLTPRFADLVQAKFPEKPPRTRGTKSHGL